jgi:hypothetical protein
MVGAQRSRTRLTESRMMEDLSTDAFRQGRKGRRDHIKRADLDYDDLEGLESHSEKFELNFATVTVVAQAHGRNSVGSEVVRRNSGRTSSRKVRQETTTSE